MKKNKKKRTYSASFSTHDVLSFAVFVQIFSAGKSDEKLFFAITYMFIPSGFFFAVWDEKEQKRDVFEA